MCQALKFYLSLSLIKNKFCFATWYARTQIHKSWKLMVKLWHLPNALLKPERMVVNHCLWERSVVENKSCVIAIGDHLNVWWNQIVKNQQYNQGQCLTVKVRVFHSEYLIENLWDVLEKTLCSGPTFQWSIQDLGEKMIATLNGNKCDIA